MFELPIPKQEILNLIFLRDRMSKEDNKKVVLTGDHEIRATEVARTHAGKVECSLIYAKLTNRRS